MPVAQSLVAGGVTVMELTLRTPVALDALKAVRTEVPEMIAGVGTILTPDQVRLATESGARIRRLSRGESKGPGSGPRSQPFLCPGRGDARTDIEAALEHGCRLLNFSGRALWRPALSQCHRGSLLPSRRPIFATRRAQSRQYGDLSGGPKHRGDRRLMAGTEEPDLSGFLERNHQTRTPGRHHN